MIEFGDPRAVGRSGDFRDGMTADVPVGAQPSVPDPPQQLPERGIVTNVRPQRQPVEEVADERLDLARIAAAQLARGAVAHVRQPFANAIEWREPTPASQIVAALDNRTCNYPRPTSAG